MEPHRPPNKVFPVPYQVDFTVESKGRHLDSTKRKLIWKFGFAHPPSVFPHMYDADENYRCDGGGGGPSDDNPKRGIECRGREHEVILTWSLLTGKAHIYVDSREIYRHAPVKDEIFNPFSASFHKGFDLPNSKYNGRHRIDIRCYARTPLGAKNMVVDDSGGKFRQYDLTVDGLSYFNFPALFELGTDRMWEKVSRWGLMREQSYQEEGTTGNRQFENNNNGEFKSHGRMEDEYHFEKAQRRANKETYKYGTSISRSEYKAMSPRSESEEERMIRIAMEASKREFANSKTASSGSLRTSSSAEENDSTYGNGNGQQSYGRSNSRHSNREGPTPPSKLSSIGEDDNLIDFGDIDEATKKVSQISISRQTTSDVSVLGDDDATTASFVLNTAWNSNNGVPPPPPPQMSPRGMYPMPQYQDPTFSFRSQYAQSQQPWSSVGTISTNPATPRGQLPSDASFAVPPPPTWDDYNNAFGGSTRSMGPGSVIGGSVTQGMSPMSNASVGMTSPMAHMGQQQQPPQYGMQQASQFSYSGGSGGPAPMASPQLKNSKFDPLRADPFLHEY